MVTDSLIRKKFVADTLREGVSEIYARQQRSISARLEKRSGRLEEWSARRLMELTASDSRVTVSIGTPVYLRFLDMMYGRRKGRYSRFMRRNYPLYNRVVWGVIYRQTIPQLRYGFTEEVREGMRTDLNQLFSKYE